MLQCDPFLVLGTSQHVAERRQSQAGAIVRYFEDSNLYAKRWQRREPQTLTVLKKAVLDTSTTEVARRFQFQAFDLDGNGTVSKSEIDMMLTLVRGEEPSKEEVDEIMLKADPAA